VTTEILPSSPAIRRGARHQASHRPAAIKAADARPVAGHRRRLYLVSRRVGVAAVGLLLLAGTLAPSAVTAAAVPIAVGGALLGLPHGAVDHVVPGWLSARPLPWRSLAALLLVYVAVAAAGAAALRLAPAATLVVFLAVAGWHFGRGEAATAAEAAGRPVPGAGEDLLPTLAHALVAVALPLLAHPEATRVVLVVLAPDLPPPSAWVRTAVLALALAVAGAAVLRLVITGRGGEAAELALLTAAFAVVNPIAMFGVYFGFWHALRHTARLVDLAAPAGPVAVGVRRFALHAALPTAGALLVLAGVWVTAHLAPDSGSSALLVTELATLAALTFPHACVVALLDVRRGRAAAAGSNGSPG
jgi:Brp/Blh family beta-carotene 15,15'-monooxygenase